jgi:A/G-specific adenine glycosylase
MLSPVSSRLLEWYERSARSMPWRGHPDPYAVWVSEIMLQQTRVETVIPYFERWMARFPRLSDLAAAEEQDVLKLWEGLGYYSRARNLHRAARWVVEQYGGRLPASRDELAKLPGVGGYTAGAVASIAFGLDEAALDGNIRRVLARVFDVEIPARSPAGERRLWELSRENLPPGRAGDYNQALMDLGATICLPQNPTCLLCPLADICQARAAGTQQERPILPVKAAVPHYIVTAAVIRSDDRVLIARRPRDGLLGGMWEFPGGKQQAGETLPECLQREIREELDAVVTVGEKIGVYRHAYTHFKVTLHAYFSAMSVGEARPLHAEEIRWVRLDELSSFPMGKIDRMISRALLEKTA